MGWFILLVYIITVHFPRGTWTFVPRYLQLFSIHRRMQTILMLTTTDEKSTKKHDRYQRLYQALVAYRTIYGNLMIPYSFIIPASDDGKVTWPDGLAGLKLGAYMHRIRKRGDYAAKREELEAIGFEFNAIERRKNESFEVIIEALEIYNKQHGNLLVPALFSVPATPPWPERCWGLKLGRRVDHIRNKGGFSTNPVYMQRLDDIGFSWDSIRDKRGYSAGFGYVYKALHVFKSIYGHIKVPRDFVVPHEDPWPHLIRGLKLGTKVSHIRNRGDFSAYRELLDDMGFVWAAWNDRQFTEIFEGLKEIELNKNK